MIPTDCRHRHTRLSIFELRRHATFTTPNECFIFTTLTSCPSGPVGGVTCTPVVSGPILAGNDCKVLVKETSPNPMLKSVSERM